MAAHAKPADAGHGHDAGAMHLPHGSWWPFWLANAIAAFGISILVFGHNLKRILLDPSDPYSGYAWGDLGILPIAMLGMGVGLVVLTLLGWVREDFKWWNSNTGTGLHVPKAGTLLFIGSEVFLFGGLFATYFAFQGTALDAGQQWPGSNHEGEKIHLPLLKTAIFSAFLFASSATLHKAEGHLKRNEKPQFHTWWLLTILLGLVFLGGQVWEYSNLMHEGHTLGSSSFITAFFMLTGTHGLHVFGGLCFLTIVYVRSLKGQFDGTRHAAPQCAGMYWHFVDIVWVVVFGVVYLLNAI